MASETLIAVPQLDLRGALAAANDFAIAADAERYVIDFAEVKWTEPFGMLFFASALRSFKRRRKDGRFRAVNYEHLDYAAFMGFFQSFGLNFGSIPNAEGGTLRYVPIKALPVNELSKEAASRREDIRETIEMRATALATVLTRGEDEDLSNTLSYSLREILRNVIEHSKADTLWYAAQYWPTKGKVELAVLDEGVGIRNTLARNPHLSILDDAGALRCALLPGVSGVAYAGSAAMREDDIWANSGYGLFMTSQLCALGGSFFICSGDAAFLLENNSESEHGVQFRGTALRLCMNVGEVRGLKSRLGEFRKKGARIAASLRHKANVKASMSSRMLRKDIS